MLMTWLQMLMTTSCDCTGQQLYICSVRSTGCSLTFTLQVHTTFRKKHPFTLTFRIKAPFHIHIQKKDPFTFTLLVHIHIQNITKSVEKKAQKNPKNDKFYDFHSWHPVCSKKSPKSLLANIQTNAA